MMIYIVITLTFFMAWIFAHMAKGILFYARKTDNELIIKAAAQAEHWGWLSGMHSYASGKAHMKEFAVAALAVIQRLLKDRSSDYSLVVLCIVSNTICSVLIFLIGSHYWGETVGLVLFALFTFSFWPALIALWGGVVAVAQAVGLLSIYFLQLAETGDMAWRLFWYTSTGVTVALIFFSSASSRKYLPLTAAAFFWSMRSEFAWSISRLNIFSGAGPWVIILVLILLLGALLLKILIRPLTVAVYTQKAPIFLNRLIQNRTRSLEEYMAIAARIEGVCFRFIFLIDGLLLLNLVFVQSYIYWLSFMVLGVGFFVTVFLFIYPHVKESLSGYYIYSQYGKPLWRSRFYDYREYFASIGKPIADDMRGAGGLWVVKYFNLMAPLPLYLYLLSGCFLIYDVGSNFSWGRIFMVVTMVVLSVFPVLTAEMTGAVQVGRSYYPGFLGILILIGYALFRLQPFLSGQEGIFFWIFLGGSLIVNAVVNMRIFVSDIFPSRMAVRDLFRVLCNLGIKEFFSYDTIYNEIFLHCLPEDLKERFNIKWIKSINEVSSGYVVVTPTNAKAATMYDYPVAQQKQNKFTEDLVLNELIESKEIERKTIASFVSMGSSRFWVHEGEVPSYRFLILQEVTPMDLYRGKAWLLKI